MMIFAFSVLGKIHVVKLDIITVTVLMKKESVLISRSGKHWNLEFHDIAVDAFCKETRSTDVQTLFTIMKVVEKSYVSNGALMEGYHFVNNGYCKIKSVVEAIGQSISLIDGLCILWTI